MPIKHDFKLGDAVVWINSPFLNCPGCGRHHTVGTVSDVSGFYDLGIQFEGHPCWIRISPQDLRKEAEYRFTAALKGHTV